MAFHLTSDISIGDLVLVKAAKVTWKTAVTSFTDTCTIDLPRITYLKTVKTVTQDGNLTERQEYTIKEGDPITIKLGYDGENTKRFHGFVKRVNMGIPVKIECEGYSYQLYDVTNFNRSYQSVTVKNLLTDLTQGTDIVLAKEIPEIPLKNVKFKNATGIQVLEWLKNECKLAVYFNFNELYCGTLFGKPQATVKLKIGWNTIKDDDFKQRIID